MINFCVVCTDTDLAQQVATGLRDAGATSVDVLAEIDESNPQSKNARNSRYIFIVQSPQEKLLAILPSSLSEQAFAEDLAGWHQKQSDLMSAYEAKRSKSILVTYALVGSDFGHLVQLVNKKWRQRLNETFPDGGARFLPKTDTLAQSATDSKQHRFVGYLVQGLIEQTPNLQQMQSKIDLATGTAPILFDVLAAMGSYREDSQRSAKKIADLEGLHQTLKSDLGSTQKQKLELENQHHSIKTELESTKQQNKDLDTQLKDAREEGELLLTQLHQVQEKLESYFLKFKDAESLHASQQQSLKSELASTQQRNKDLEGKLKVAQEESQKHAKRVAELEAQQQSLRSELASTQQRTKDLEAKLKVAQEESQKHAKRVAELEAQQQSLKSELAAAQQRNKNLDAKLKEATTESELLLVQLHQVQEELENYFLKFKDAENRYDLLQHRRRKMLASCPDYADYEWVGVEPKEEPHVFQWHFKGLESAGISRNEVIFETFIEAGVLGVRFHKTPISINQESGNENGVGNHSNIDRSLLYWPKVAMQLDYVECIPAGRGDLKVLRAAVLKGLSTSDFRLLKVIPKLVIQAIEEQPIDGEDKEQLKLAALRLQEGLDRLPSPVRYDGLRLKNHQVNPDYEHLWMVFENLMFGHQQWPKFEIRLGVSKLRDGAFSHYVKVEIPLIDNQIKPFGSWFEESVDDFGAKWELRFDLKKQIMDTGVWSELKNQEQSLIKGLLNELIQAGLQQIEPDIKRGERVEWEKAFGLCLGLMD